MQTGHMGQPIEKSMVVNRFYFKRKGRKYAIGQCVDTKGYLCRHKDAYGIVDEVTKEHVIVTPLIRDRLEKAGLIGKRGFE